MAVTRQLNTIFSKLKLQSPTDLKHQRSSFQKFLFQFSFSETNIVIMTRVSAREEDAFNEVVTKLKEGPVFVCLFVWGDPWVAQVQLKEKIVIMDWWLRGRSGFCQ